MDAERWIRVKAIFHEAADLAASERIDYIRTRCDGDVALAAQIEELLWAHDQDLSFFETPVLQNINPGMEDQQIWNSGKLIGPYRIVHEIGSGGMGSVYLGERADKQFEKRVAIKVIRLGFGDALIIGRFIAERQMLARLEHANIARMLDGGTTQDGLPYLVMEYVEGKQITRTVKRGSFRQPSGLFCFGWFAPPFITRIRT